MLEIIKESEEKNVENMTFSEAMERLDREERFKATTSAINALLMAKGIYSHLEFEAYFLESAKARIKKQQAGVSQQQE